MPAPAFFGSEFLANLTFKTSSQYGPDIAVLPTGEFVIGWVSYRPPTPNTFDGLATRLTTQKFTTLGYLADPAWFETNGALPLFAGHGAFELTPTRIAYEFSSEGFLGLQLTSFAFDYASTGPGVVPVDTFVKPQFGNQAGLEAFQLSSGVDAEVFLIAPTNFGAQELAVRLFAPSGVSQVILNASPIGDASGPLVRFDAVGLNGGGFIAAWTDSANGGDVVYRLFTNAGAATTAALPGHATSATNQTAPALAALPGGGAVMVYVDVADASIRSAVISSTGVRTDHGVVTPSGSAPVITLPNSTALAPAVTALPDGRYFVAWTESATVEGADGSGLSIRGQLMTAAGAKDGVPITINTTKANDQFDVQLATLPDGRIVVSWQSNDADSGDIRAQILDPREGPYVALAAPQQAAGTVFGDTIYGGPTDDQYSGMAGDDLIFGLAGKDLLNGGAGFDTVLGGDGADTLSGEGGNDTLIGEAGADSIDGGDGNDVLWGGAEADTIHGGYGVDWLLGEDGNDDLNGGYGVSVYVGGGGNDVMRAGLIPFRGMYTTLITTETQVFYSGSGDDVAFGSQGVDWLFGDEGNDQLYGDANNDMYYGGAGNDAITMWEGPTPLPGSIDYAWGGEGADTFVTRVGDAGVEVIMDFQAGPGAGDVVRILNSRFANFTELLDGSMELNGYTIILLGGPEAVYLSGVTKAQLAADDFILG